MKSINEINNGLATIDGLLIKQNANKQIGIKDAMQTITDAMAEYKVLGLKERKARKAMKAAILNGLEDETNKSVTRAYGIAFTIEFRGLKIHTDFLSVAQCENLANHGAVKRIEQLYALDAIQY